MQYGASQLAIVQSMEGLRLYRGAYATYCKRRSQRAHRHRIAIDLKLIARGAIDEEAFDGQPKNTEACNAWDIW
jgi:hypothetical protein